jgi:hypothetical protein
MTTVILVILILIHLPVVPMLLLHKIILYLSYLMRGYREIGHKNTYQTFELLFRLALNCSLLAADFFVYSLHPVPRIHSSESKRELSHICSWKLWYQPVFSSSVSSPWPVVYLCHLNDLPSQCWGSGSFSHKYGSGSGYFFHQSKLHVVRKTLTSTVL